MSQKDDRVYVGHMIDTANKAMGFVTGSIREDFDEDEQLRLALTHLLQVIGEAARRVSPEFRDAYPEIPWNAIVGMGRKVVPDYLNVDEDVVWDTVQHDLTSFVTDLENILAEST